MFEAFPSLTPEKNLCNSDKFPASGFVLASTEDILKLESGFKLVS